MAISNKQALNMSCDSFPKLEMLVEKQCTESQTPTYNHYYEGTKKRSIRKIVGDRAIWRGGEVLMFQHLPSYTLSPTPTPSNY